MTAEPPNSEVIEKAVEAAQGNRTVIQDNTTLILDRIGASDKNTTEKFHDVNIKITALTKEVRHTNGKLSEVDEKVGILEDRGKQAAERAARRLNWIAVLVTFAGGSAFLAVVVEGAKLLGSG